MTWNLRRYADLMSIGRRPSRDVRAIPHLEELDAYVGRWVAVKDGHVVAAADTSVELARQIRKDPAASGATMQHVPPAAHTFIVGVG